MVEDFVKKFHGLTGTLLKDRKKNFHLLLESYRTIENNEDILSEINAKLQPRTYLEQTYKLEFLIYFKRSSELLALLKSGNDIATSRIVKQKWFLDAILKDATPEKFVKDVLPKLSLVVRLKILNQILKQFKDEDFINSLFDEILNTYGYTSASVLIPGCSTDKIKSFLIDRGFRISMPQLKLLHDKDRTLIRFFYEGYRMRGGNMHALHSFSLYLSRKDPTLFMELRVKYEFTTYYHLGRRATKSFVAKNKDSLIENPQKYIDMDVLEKGNLVKQLGEEFPKFLKATFPESSSLLCNSSITFNLLEHYPKKKRYDLFSNLFKEVYDRDLFKSKNVMTENILEIIPSHEEREKWVEVLDNEVKYIKYKRSSIAIPELKEQLFRADDITYRKEIFEYIITSCAVSEDYDSLLDILKLICERYRNEDGGALYSVLNKINEKIDLYKLNEEHWRYIHEIIMLQDMRNISINDDLVFEYCKFLHKSGESFEKMVPIFLKCAAFFTRNNFVDEKFQDENFQKTFLVETLKNYPLLDEKYQTSTQALHIVMTIRKWNKKHSKEKIQASTVKPLVEKIQEEVKQNWVYCLGAEMRSLKYFICAENDTDDFEDIYFENLSTLANYSITRWFLKYKPEVFQKHIDTIHLCFTAKGRYLTRILKKLEYSGLVKVIQDHYLEKLKAPNQSTRDEFAQLLSSIMPTENYLELMEKFTPKVDKIDVLKASEEEINLLQIGISLAKSVRFSNCQSKAFPILFRYCKGDCLQPALLSLYSCFNRIPEKDLEQYLPLLLKKPVSLRKHAIFLAALVFPINIFEDIWHEMLKEENDISVKKHLFTSCYKYFLKNPLESLWGIMQIYIASLTIHDKESLDLITNNIHKIPDKFRGKFAETVWQTLQKLEEINKNSVKIYYDNFFSGQRDYDVRFFSTQFCMEIINKKLFEETEGHKRNAVCSKFAIQFMMYSEDIAEAVKNILEILRDYKMKYWHSKEEELAKSTIFHFCREIFDKAMNTEHLRMNIPSNFPLIFKEKWKEIFTQEETFEEYLMLEFMILKYDKNPDIEMFSRRIGELFECARKSYGDLILGIFREFFKSSLILLLGNEKYTFKLMEFLKYFIDEGPSSPARFLLIIDLLPVCNNDENFRKNYKHVLTKIRSFPDSLVSISLNTHFKELVHS